MTPAQEQYFQPHHYAAFDPPKPDLDGEKEPARQERRHVRDALLFLGDQLWPWISKQGWDLHRHRQKEHYTSSYHFVYMPDGQPIVDQIGSMWLHYGKSPEQLDWLKNIGGFDHTKRDVDDYYNAFYLHTRIQVYISASVVRCWLLLATDKNYYDRSEYLKRLIKNPAYEEQLWQAMQPLLGKHFFYEIDEERFDLNVNIERKDLMKFIRRDRSGVYSGIVKEYQPDDYRISRSAILPEIQNCMGLLYPVYDVMAWRPKKTVENPNMDLTNLFKGAARVSKSK